MFQSILVPLDGSTVSERAIPLAVDLAQRAQARLVLMRAADETNQGETSDYLERIAVDLRRSRLEVEVAAPVLAPASAILSQIEAAEVDLVVMTTHGRSGFGKLLFGSIAEAVLARSTTPVLMVHAEGEATTLGTLAEVKLLVPLDGSSFAESVLAPARKLARTVGGSLILVHALQPHPGVTERLKLPSIGLESVRIADTVEARTYLGDWADRLELEGIAARTVERYGDPADVIVEECQKAHVAMIVMATHGRSGRFDRPFGSVAVEVLRRTGLPVLLVRPQPAGSQVDASSQAEVN